MTMRILYLANTYAPETGWGRYAEGFRAVFARRAGFKIEAPSPASLRSRHLSFKQMLWLPFDAFRLYRSARRSDIIHALTEPMAPLAWLLSRLTGTPYVVSIAGSYGDLAVYAPSIRWLYRLAIGKATRLSVLSRYTKQVVERNFPSTPMTMVHGGFTAPIRTPDVRSQAFDPPRIFSVGAIKRRKGFHTLINAIERLSVAGFRVRCDIVGPVDEPDYGRMLEEMVKKIGLTDAVTMHGKVSEQTLEDLYRRADLFVLPSEHAGAEFEGLGLVYLEALSHGVPVIGCLQSGAEDIIRDGENGKLVPPGDADGLARAIRSCLESQEAWKKMSQTARPSVERFSWDRVADGMEGLYQEVVKVR